MSWRDIWQGRPAAQNAAIGFPNNSRSFDPARRVVLFWGSNGALEAAFYIGEAALRRLHPDMPSDEAAMLAAFDSARDRINAVAAKVYDRGRKGVYELQDSDF